jgi:hypothetical protein
VTTADDSAASSSGDAPTIVLRRGRNYAIARIDRSAAAIEWIDNTGVRHLLPLAADNPDVWIADLAALDLDGDGADELLVTRGPDLSLTALRVTHTPRGPRATELRRARLCSCPRSDALAPVAPSTPRTFFPAGADVFTPTGPQ